MELNVLFGQHIRKKNNFAFNFNESTNKSKMTLQLIKQIFNLPVHTVSNRRL